MNITKENSSLVVMDEAAITDATADRHILASGGAADCLIIAAYSKSEKWAYIIHATRSTNLRSVHKHILLFPPDVDVYLSSTSFKNDPKNPLVLEIKELFAGGERPLRITSESDTGMLAIDAKTGEVVADFNSNLCSFANPAMVAGSSSKRKVKASNASKYKVTDIPTFKKADSVTLPPPVDPLVAEQERLAAAEKREAQQQMMRKDLEIYSYGESAIKGLSKIFRV